jgi:hypothetical protein
MTKDYKSKHGFLLKNIERAVERELKKINN